MTSDTEVESKGHFRIEHFRITFLQNKQVVVFRMAFQARKVVTLGARRFWPRKETTREHFAYQDSDLFKIFKLFVFTIVKLLNNMSVVVGEDKLNR